MYISYAAQNLILILLMIVSPSENIIINNLMMSIELSRHICIYT